MDIKKTLVILNGFVHDFAAGIWLAAIATITLLHRAHSAHPEITGAISTLEHQFFWASIAAMVLIMATGAGRTFTYVENWYGPDAERIRRRMLIVKHVILFACFGAGYFVIFNKVFH
jgi:putative copper export protein